MIERHEIAVIGSGFAGSLMARILARIGYDVVLLERGTHPRFAIGESTTPLANLSLERIARRYGMPDCYYLAAHGRWLEHYPHLRRGLKRGFTFYRHHPGGAVDSERLASERLLVAASPNDAISDTHWFRADVDHHFVREAIAAGVDYRDRTELAHATFGDDSVQLGGRRDSGRFEMHVDFVVDASGPGGFVAQQLSIPSRLARTLTRSAILFSHFADVKLVQHVYAGLPEAPYPEDWAAVHHLVDEGWMYSLRFDDDVTSAGFALRPDAFNGAESPSTLWQRLMVKYPTIAALFAEAKPSFPLAFRPLIQHRLARAAGGRWVMLPHAYAFVDPLFSTGIAWSLRAIERLALAFESRQLPQALDVARYETLLADEADQIDRFVAGAYEAMAHFELFAAHAMIYFAAVSFAETRQRLNVDGLEPAAWSGFLGVGDPVLEPLPAASLERLRAITRGASKVGTAADCQRYVDWMRCVIEPRNIGGFGDPSRRHLYPVDLDLLIEKHAVLGMTRERLVAGLPALRGE